MCWEREGGEGHSLELTGFNFLEGFLDGGEDAECAREEGGGV